MPTTITDYYAKDHDRLDGLFKTFQIQKKADFAKAKEAFVKFKYGLQRHIVWEEDILFPLFEKKTGLSEAAGPTAVMRTEHRQIKAALEAIHDRVAQNSPETDIAEARLFAVLYEHNLKEEKIVYPAVDGAITDEERNQVFSQMEAVPRERYETCC